MYIKLNYYEGEFSCQEIPEEVKNFLLNDDVHDVEITCDSPFTGTPETLAALAVEFLNEKYQENWRFNIILTSNTEYNNVTRNVGFQMCRGGF